MLGGIHANGYWALISSLATGPKRRHSPGDLALRRTIAACGEQGLSFFDFSAGDAPYKRQWADDTIELFHAVQARSLKGLVWCCGIAAFLLGKRIIKRTPLLKALALSARRKLLGKRAD
jgi:CelD/BcsL family acetyltransferase involved in cellulose biosynthesis